MCDRNNWIPPKPNQTILYEDLAIPVYDEISLKPFLHKKDDKIHVINFWATWCKPCIDELPHFEKINKEMAEQNVEVLLVNMDFEKDWESNLPRFIQKHIQSNVIIVLPENEETFIYTVSKNWQTGAIPVTLIYNQRKRYFIEGQIDYEELLHEIEKFKD